MNRHDSRSRSRSISRSRASSRTRSKSPPSRSGSVSPSEDSDVSRKPCRDNARNRSPDSDRARSRDRPRDLDRDRHSAKHDNKKSGRDEVDENDGHKSRSGRKEHQDLEWELDRGRDRSIERKRRRRKRSASRDSHSDSESSHHRKRTSSSDKKDKKKKKKRETSEERRIRKAERKANRKAEKALLKQELLAQKESQIAAQMSATLGYSNTENPFGDSNLNQKFVWVKKREIDVKQGLTGTLRLEKEMQRKQEMQGELEKLSKRRTEREIEMQLREQEQLRMQRDQDAMAVGEWIAREDDFQLEQAKIRAQIRIKEGRARPIDVLAINLSLSSDSKLAREFDALGLEMDINEPYLIFQNLQLREVEELHRDIQLYLSLEKDPENKRFWEAMLIVCDSELIKQKKMWQEPSYGRRNGGGRTIEPEVPRTGVSESVSRDIDRMLEPKTLNELTQLQHQIEDKLGSGAPVDVDYWEATLKSILIWKSKAHLRDMHTQMLKKRIAALRAHQDANDVADSESSGQDKANASEKPAVVQKTITFDPVSSNRYYGSSRFGGGGDARGMAKNVVESEAEEYDPSMSPKLYDGIEKEDEALEVIEEQEDLRRLQEARRVAVEKYTVVDPVPAMMAAARANVAAPALASASTDLSNTPGGATDKNAPEQAFIREVSRNMSSDEIVMTDEAVISKTTYLWQDKYRPRKPRYFNRVHTGYEWNKYNQTHYDSANPPPKVVQGYKFNIFYPDLIDRTKAPTYHIEKDPLSDDTVIIRFTAGPPYEDVAFRIVKKEWEHSHKRGFRSSFDRGILQLWFHFRRAFYRR